MSQPIPERKPSVFPVPDSVGAVLIGGGCGAYHTAQNGAVDCAVCYPNAPAFAPVESATGGIVDLSAYPPVLAGESGPEITQPAKARKTQPTE